MGRRAICLNPVCPATARIFLGAILAKPLVWILGQSASCGRPFPPYNLPLAILITVTRFCLVILLLYFGIVSFSFPDFKETVVG